jgi:hypothetical protein
MSASRKAPHMGIWPHKIPAYVHFVSSSYPAITLQFAKSPFADLYNLLVPIQRLGRAVGGFRYFRRNRYRRDGYGAFRNCNNGFVDARWASMRSPH